MALSRAVVSALADDEATLAALPCEEARILRAVFEKARSDDEKAAADIAVEPQEKAPAVNIGDEHSLVSLKEGDANEWAALASMRLRAHVVNRLVDLEHRRRVVEPYKLLEPDAPIPTVSIPSMKLSGGDVEAIEQASETRRRSEMQRKVALVLPGQHASSAAAPTPSTPGASSSAPSTPAMSVKQEPAGSADRARQFQNLQDQLSNVLQRLKKNKEHSWPFRRPVTPQEAPDYRQIISEPMDLGTMRTRLENNFYTSKALFQRDLDLIWSNCFRYNNDTTSPFRTNAKHMKTLADSLLQQIPELPEPAFNFVAPTFAVPEVAPLVRLPDHTQEEDIELRRRFYFDHMSITAASLKEGTEDESRALPGLQAAVASLVLRNNYESVSSPHVLDVLVSVAERAFAAIGAKAALQGPEKALEATFPRGVKELSRYLTSLHRDELTAASPDKVAASPLLSFVSQQLQAQQLQQAQPGAQSLDDKRMDVYAAQAPLAKLQWRRFPDGSPPLFNVQRSIPQMPPMAPNVGAHGAPHPQQHIQPPGTPHGMGSQMHTPQGTPGTPHGMGSHPGTPLQQTPQHHAPSPMGPGTGSMPPSPMSAPQTTPLQQTPPGAANLKRGREDEVDMFGARKKQRLENEGVDKMDTQEAMGDAEGSSGRQQRVARAKSNTRQGDPYIRD